MKLYDSKHRKHINNDGDKKMKNAVDAKKGEAK